MKRKEREVKKSRPKRKMNYPGRGMLAQHFEEDIDYTQIRSFNEVNEIYEVNEVNEVY